MASAVSRQGLRLAAYYLGGVALAFAGISVLMVARSPEYIDYALIVVAAFGVPWTFALWADLPAAVQIIIAVGCLPLNAALLYVLGATLERRPRRETTSPAT